MGLSEITKLCIYPLHLLKSLFFLPVPQVAQKSYFIAERCQNFKQAPSLSPVSPSSFPLIPERLGCSRLLTLTCSSARIMLASLSILRGKFRDMEQKLLFACQHQCPWQTYSYHPYTLQTHWINTAFSSSNIKSLLNCGIDGPILFYSCN